MNKFTVPQFIDVEDKIIGPVTTRQFIIMLSGFIIIAVGYKIFDFSLFITMAIFIFALSGTFAFARINGRPFHFFLLNVIQTFKKPKIRIWNHKAILPEKEEEAPAPLALAPVPVKKFSSSRLAELSLIVNTKGGYKGEGGAEGNLRMESDDKNNYGRE